MTTQLTEHGSCLWIRASPLGTRSGFAVLPDGAGGRVTVTVLPKPWSLRRGAVQAHIHQPGETTHVILHETESVAIDSPSSSVGSMVMSLADVARHQPDLIVLGAPTAEPLCDPIEVDSPFEQLIQLMSLAERGSLKDSPLTFEGTLAPSLLRLLTHERLLSTVEDLIFRARPRYVECTDLLAMPRGRLSAKSLMFSQATGTPRVKSTFDELTTDTPLLQVVAAALRVVGTDRFPPKIAALRPGTQTRATRLLSQLSSVTLIGREQALLAAERLWIGPLDRAWKPAVEASTRVLRGLGIVAEDGSENTSTVFMHISTEKFWEQCLQLALDSVFNNLGVSRDGEAGTGVSVPAPWVLPDSHSKDIKNSYKKTYPDFIFTSNRRIVVADAKYKLRASHTPSSSDAYQMFAYSHLATLEGQSADIAALLYPIRPAEQAEQIALERMRERTYPLWMARLPFPTKVDIQSQSAWSIYISQLTDIIADFSNDWHSPHTYI